MKRTQAHRKPITVAVGNVKVPIYTVARTNGYTFHQVADYSNGVRRMRSFSDFAEAKREAERLARLLASGDAGAAQMRGSDASAYSRAVELLRATGDPIELATARYAEAADILKGDGSLLSAACQFYMERSPSNLPEKTVEEAVRELIATKEQQGKSRRYLEDLRSRLAKFSEAFKVQVARVMPADVQRWLDRLKGKPQTILNFRRVTGTLFAFCEARGYIPRGTNPAILTERPKVRGGSVEIYTPKELSALLAAAPPKMIPALALAAFTGARTAEVMLLDWRDVALAERFVHVSPEKSKTASRRLVPICDALAQWLAAHQRESGPIWHRSIWQFSAAMREAAQSAGVILKPNGLRHSFASYRLAQTQNAAQVALEMGNSPAMVFKHYREIVKPADAAAWFAVTPEAPANIVPLRKEAVA